MYSYSIIQLGDTRVNRENGIRGGEYLFGSAGNKLRWHLRDFWYLVNHDGEVMRYTVKKAHRTNFKMIIETDEELLNLDYTE